MKQKIFAAMASFGALVLSAGLAAATTFSATWDVTDFNDEDPGLVLGFNGLPGSGSIDLDEGDTVGFNAFEIYTDETYVNLDDTFWKPITVSFSFTAPDALNGDITGETRGVWLFQKGIVEWDGPLVLNFGPQSSGQFTVTLFDTIFNQGCLLCGMDEGQEYAGTVRGQISYDLAPIPLPAAGWMLLAGIGGLAALRRRQKTA